MQIDLSDKLIEQIKLIAIDGEDTETVIAEAVARLVWERQEVAAVQEGIDAYERGDHRPWDEFAAEFMAEHGITPER